MDNVPGFHAPGPRSCPFAIANTCAGPSANTTANRAPCPRTYSFAHQCPCPFTDTSPEPCAGPSPDSSANRRARAIPLASADSGAGVLKLRFHFVVVPLVLICFSFLVTDLTSRAAAYCTITAYPRFDNTTNAGPHPCSHDHPNRHASPTAHTKPDQSPSTVSDSATLRYANPFSDDESHRPSHLFPHGIAD